jgi:hypothetical protein
MVPEIETLLGRQSLADLDFAAVEMAGRPQAVDLGSHISSRADSDFPVACIPLDRRKKWGFQTVKFL